MKSITKRMSEFVSYHINGDGECNTIVLSEWANRKKLDLQERFELSYFFSITYAVESAVILFENRFEMFSDINTWVEKNKPKIVFQSDRKYIRMKDSFNKCLFWFKENRNVERFLSKVKKNSEIDLKTSIIIIENWPLFGRFSAFLFLEMFVNLCRFEIKNTTIDWKHGNTATSGLLNLYGYDKEANYFDKTGSLIFNDEKMDSMLLNLIQRIESEGGSANVTEIETSLCAYRKFYKGSRYNGYYLDRMLEEMNKMEADFPEVVNEIKEIRYLKFDHRYLGEINGWNGIRKPLKRLYKDTGIIS